MKYNTSEIMLKAWKNHRKGIAFTEALHRAWMSAKVRPLMMPRWKLRSF